MSANMEKFKINRFPNGSLPLRKRKRVPLKNGQQVTQLEVKEKGSGVTASGIGSSAARLSKGRAPKKDPP